MAHDNDIVPAFDEFVAIVNAASRPVALLDLGTLRIVAISASGAERLGFTVGDLVDKRLTNSQDHDEFLRTIGLLRTGKITACAGNPLLHTNTGVTDSPIWTRAIETGTSTRLAALIPLRLSPTVADSLQAVADISAAVGSVDERGRIRQLSIDVKPLLGYEPADLIGTMPEELIHPHDVDSVRTAFVNASPTRASVNVVVRVRDAAGTWRSLSVIATPRDDERGSVFAATLATPLEVNPANASARRVAELERRLLRIGREVEAAGLGGPAIPDPETIPGLEDLTARQWQILVRLLHGDRVATIAKEMFLSASTVRNHLSVIYRRLGVHSQAELIEKLRPGHA
jgi:PAS domain S-box-containing protein